MSYRVATLHNCLTFLNIRSFLSLLALKSQGIGPLRFDFGGMTGLSSL